VEVFIDAADAMLHAESAGEQIHQQRVAEFLFEQMRNGGKVASYFVCRATELRNEDRDRSAVRQGVIRAP
jgi:hypothetical protein